MQKPRYVCTTAVFKVVFKSFQKAVGVLLSCHKNEESDFSNCYLKIHQSSFVTFFSLPVLNGSVLCPYALLDVK